MFYKTVKKLCFLFILVLFLFNCLEIKTFASFFESEASLNNQVKAGSFGNNEESLTLKVDNTEYSIKNVLSNSNFDEDLNNWQIAGEVIWQQEEVMLGGGESNISENNLSQQVSSDTPFYSIAFWYSLNSEETEVGFDDPCFMVFVDDELVYQDRAEDALGVWQLAVINIADLKKTSFNLKFQAGNTVDNLKPSFVLLDNIQTNLPIINSTASFEITKPYSTINCQYSIAGTTVISQEFEHLSLSLNDQPDDYLINYWFDNEENKQLIVYFDNTPPEGLNDLVITDEGDSEYSLSFTSPGDDSFSRVSKYFANNQVISRAAKRKGLSEEIIVSDFIPSEVILLDVAGNIN